VAGQWFSLHPPVTPTNKTGRHDITEILLKVALNTITLTLTLLEGQSTKWTPVKIWHHIKFYIYPY
jgi:hypothetical protein